MKIPLYQIDAFATRTFEGNPAAVCFLNRDQADILPNETLQKIAAENNLSETAFVSPRQSPSGFHTDTQFALRWFTPKKEVPLCGHATLASAAAVFLCAGNAANSLEFSTLSGQLTVARASANTKDDDSFLPQLRMTLPMFLAEPIQSELMEKSQPEACRCLGVDAEVCILYEPKVKYMVMKIRGLSYTRDQFEKLVPKFDRMEPFFPVGADEPRTLTGVIVTAAATESEYDFHCRFFAPWVGIDEDPVTGSAYSILGPYWSRILSKNTLKARQCSERGGDVTVHVNWEEGNILIEGGAVVVIKGELHLPDSFTIETD